MTASQLRSKVVLLVVWALVGMTAALYGLIGLLLLIHQWQHDSLEDFALPGELWIAAGFFGAGVVGLLNNSKGGSEGGVVPSGTPRDPVTVREASPADGDV